MWGETGRMSSDTEKWSQPAKPRPCPLPGIVHKAGSDGRLTVQCKYIYTGGLTCTMLTLHLEFSPFLLHFASADNFILLKVTAVAESYRQWLS